MIMMMFTMIPVRSLQRRQQLTFSEYYIRIHYHNDVVVDDDDDDVVVVDDDDDDEYDATCNL